MTPTEKGKELIEKLRPLVGLQLTATSGSWFPNAKLAAIILCDEIIEIFTPYSVYNASSAEIMEYWQQVKSEIQKL